MATGNTVVTYVCTTCEKRLDEAANAMRRHGAQMTSALQLIQSGRLTEEERQEFQTRMSATFLEAQSAWDAYREHLIEHGILPERP